MVELTEEAWTAELWRIIQERYGVPRPTDLLEAYRVEIARMWAERVTPTNYADIIAARFKLQVLPPRQEHA